MATVEPKADGIGSLYDAVLKDLSSGFLAGGQRLKVAELAERYGVSTSPVREVLRRMQGEGFIEINHNRGATVCRTDPETVRDVFEMLRLLEPYFVAWFAEFAQPDMIDRMVQVQRRIEATPSDDLVTFRELDVEFHDLICQRHYNTRAVASWRNLKRALQVFAAPLAIGASRYRAILIEHEQLIAAFQANDVEAALQAIHTHLDGSFAQMSQQLRLVR